MRRRVTTLNKNDTTITWIKSEDEAPKPGCLYLDGNKNPARIASTILKAKGKNGSTLYFPISDWGNRWTGKGIDSYIPPKEYLLKENAILWWAELPEPPKEVNDYGGGAESEK